MKQENENKKKWISPNGFKNTVNKNYQVKNFIPNFMNLTPFQKPVINYNFRDVKKAKLINDNGFIL